MAIVATIVVMFWFDHGQPALLYLVPGCILMVLGTAFAKGEYSALMEFDEEEFIRAGDEDGEKED